MMVGNPDDELTGNKVGIMTPELLRLFIERIEVGEHSEKYSHTAEQDISIVYRDVGVMDKVEPVEIGEQEYEELTEQAESGKPHKQLSHRGILVIKYPMNANRWGRRLLTPPSPGYNPVPLCFGFYLSFFSRPGWAVFLKLVQFILALFSSQGSLGLADIIYQQLTRN